MPLLVGHSQGGIQLVKVLYDLAQDAGAAIPVGTPGPTQPRLARRSSIRTPASSARSSG